MTAQKKPSLKDVFAAKQLIDEYDAAEPRDPVRIIDPANYTDLGNAKRFVSLHQRNIRYVPAWRCWMCYDGKKWTAKDDRMLVPLVDEMITSMIAETAGMNSSDESEKLRKHAKNTESENRIMATIRLAAAQPGIEASPDDFDRNKYLLNFINGTLDLHTKELKEHVRDDMITRMCAIPYTPGQKRELWIGFLDKIFDRDPDVIHYMQKFIGMAFTGDVSEELFHIFHGGGANGKTTLLTTLNSILGNGYFKTMAVETLLKRGQKAIANDIARLQGARIVWANEPEFDDVLTEGKIKKMVSKERILGEMKFKEPVEFEPEYSLILSTNPNPRIRGLGKGLRRRVRKIPFNVEISDAEKDIHFAEKLRAELPGIAEWAVDGCVMWQNEGLIPPEKILQATDEYHQEQDQLSDFFNLFVVNDPQAKTPHILLYTVYKCWAQINDILVMKEKAFTQIMIEHGYKKITSRYQDGRLFKGFASVTIQEDILRSVTDIFTSPDHERGGAYDTLVTDVKHVLNPFHIKGTRTRDNLVTSVTSVTNAMENHNNIFSQSVTSVTSVTNNNQLIIKIKSLLDHINKPNTINEMENLKNNIILELMCNTDYDEYDEDYMKKAVDDYYHARIWI